MPQDRVFGLLRRARAFVQEQRDGILEGHCHLDPETCEPLRETLEEAVRPFITGADALLADIDAVLPPLPPPEEVDPRQAAYEAGRRAHYRRLGLVEK